MKKGLFITFEGPDGSGKTTVSSYVVQQLLGLGYDIIHTREPGGVDIAEQIRHVILDPQNTKMDVKTEVLLYAASRRQHLIEKILPALEEGKIVICDRFVDSSLAYQGVGRGVGFEEVYMINRFAIDDYMPDMTVYLDLSAQAGLDRIAGRKFLDRLDQEKINFHELVVEGYQEVKRRFSDRIFVVNADQEIETVQKEAYEAVLKKVKAYV
ncbi:MAG: dTMP kinase [Erysipelotrichaceae bacterium]|nr:MAG: dTMP [Erysipelotrichaceae bacterium]TXT19888.1 MAG: dTMP kinase [Erysipelotrichaceae bacterium]